MSDPDLMTDGDELRELRDSVSGIAVPDRPRLETITARGRDRRRRRVTAAARLSVVGVVAATALAVTLTSVPGRGSTLGTIRTAAYTLKHNANGTDSLTFNPGELLNPAQLQSDFNQYGIPAKVTTGSYCTSSPEPAGFAQAVTFHQGTWEKGSGTLSTITIDPSQMPSGTELTVGNFQNVGYEGREQQANFSLMNSSSYTCTSTPPDMSQPDTSDGDLGLLYGGPNPPPGS